MELVAEILKEGLTPERAKALFSMVVGPLPGVVAPAGGRDASDFDGTLAVTYIYQVWDSLTPEQRAAARELIHHPGATSAARRTSSLLYLPGLIPAAYALDFTPAYDYEYRAKDANTGLAEILNVPPVRFVLNVDDDPPKGSEYAHTVTWYDSGDEIPGGCEISIHNQRFVGITQYDAESIIEHEMFHCFQQRVMQSLTNLKSMNPWISEGEATWVMYTVVPDADKGDYLSKSGTWRPYVNQPGTLYTQRSYDGVGVFGHLSDLSGSDLVWSRLLPLVQADIGGHNADAFNALLQGYRDEFFTSWASSYFEQAGHKPWMMGGPGPVQATGPAPQAVSLDPNYTNVLTAGSDQSALFQISGGADVAIVSLLTGYGRLHDQGFSVDTALDSSAPLVLCLKQGGCKCPDGSPGASQYTTDATAPLSLGINGGDVTANIGLVGEPLEHFCKQPEPEHPPDPGPGGGGGGGGGGGDNGDQQPRSPAPEGLGWGDTHIETFDGLGYDFQVVGEYTLVRSTQDDFVVQVRQVPVLGARIASVMQSVATRAGGQRITFSMENRALILRIDGKVVSGELPRLKGGSLTGASTASGSVYQLTWPDGTVLHVQQLGSYCLNARVRPAVTRRGALAGLLGDFDGSNDNDLIGRGNARLGATRDEINHKLADAWSVSEGSSLFDYQPGQSAATFRDPGFPAENADTGRLKNYATAEKTCREHGITDQRLLDDCILDLAVTNEFVFGNQYAHAQHVLAARAAVFHRTPAPAAQAVDWVSGEILDSQSEPEYRFPAKSGDVLWIGHDPGCSDARTPGHAVFLSLIDPSGNRVQDGSRAACDFGRIELAATGTYSLRGIFKYRNETAAYKVPVRRVRPDRHRQVSYGDTISGNIEQWAAHDVYTWTGKQGDLIVLSGEGCELKVLTTIIDPGGHDSLGPSCRAGDAFKVPADGTYQLVVNGGEWSHAEMTGPYHFVFQGGKLTH